MVQFKFLWLFGLAAATVSADAPAKTPATAPATQYEFFYGKNSLSKLHVNRIVTEKNCGCTGSWNDTQFPAISKHFGAQLHKLIPKEKTTARGHKDASPLSIGSNTYTLSLGFSSNYSRPSSSGAAVWSRLISEMLIVANQTVDRSILIGEYINVLGGSHNLTLTVYGDKGCVNKFKPCAKSDPVEVKLSARHALTRVGPALDWSDKEAVIKHLNLDVYNTTSLEEAVLNNKTLPQFIYYEEHHGVIDTSTIKLAPPDPNSKLQGRQICTGVGYDTYKGEGMWSQWGDWLPISGCLYTGLNPAGGTQSLNVAYSMSYAESWNWGWSPVNSAFSASFTFTLTQQFSKSFTYGCNVPGNSVGQVYAQQYVGAGYLYKESCWLWCGSKSCTRTGPNYAAAPANNDHYNYGCSTGYSNVACKAYSNWMAYTVWSHSPPNST